MSNPSRNWPSGIWKPASIKSEPETVLTHWAIFEVGYGRGKKKTRHFVGTAWDGGRVSSAIQSFSTKVMRGTTRSGRVYALEGPSQGPNEDALYVWRIWKSHNGVKSEKRVSV